MLPRLLALFLLTLPLLAADQPNILWISIEDTGQEVAPYDLLAVTPNIGRLAAEGVTFLNAFSHAPVCAPTRSGIITGMYPTSMGTQHMRSDMVPPSYVKAFPEYLRRQGYYTTNNAKTDYNFPSPATAWDESSRQAHWKHRPDREQPFFAVFNLNSTHESAIRRQYEARMADPKNKIHDASKLILPPYYPDTPKVREAWAAYYDIVTMTDERIGELLQEIDDAGLRESTIVVFWGDHGVGLARGKRWLYDSGVKVPLIVRWPGEIEPGSVRTDLVQFLDLAPTMVSLSGGDKPDYMQGRIFLGAHAEPAPERIFHARDRMDERFDMIRAVRDQRYKYIRNFESHKPWVQFMRTPSQGPLYQELGRLKDEGGLDELTGLFMRETKPYEELYDTLVDPYEMHDLAGDPAYAERLEAMRGQLVDWMRRTGDKGLIPEPELLRTMYPHNERETAAPPKAVKTSDGRVALTAPDGASIGYTFEEGGEPRWMVYTEPLAIPAGKTLRAIAVRLGFHDSAPIAVR
jgi:uncharacterized sulfatase